MNSRLVKKFVEYVYNNYVGNFLGFVIGMASTRLVSHYWLVLPGQSPTANDMVGTQLLEVWKPAAGAGLRILFNKATRTNLCLDYAFGMHGSKGFFLNLNETF